MSFSLTPGDNCESKANADRIKFLVDAEEYFRVLREAIKLADKSVYILSWDIDSNVLLRRDKCNDGYPVKLGDFLNAIAAEKPDLNIYILNWDFTVLFLFDRELLPIYKLDWKTHSRVHFKLYDKLPDGASQHQKIVIIDDSLAFVGGLDLTKGRWDTSEHLPFNDKRDKVGGKQTRPYHDIQVMMAGDCAEKLACQVRKHWLEATGCRLPPIDTGDTSRLWPENVQPDLHKTPVGISYTYAEYGERDETRQIQKLYIDAISSARNYIYMENQYFTAPVIGEALKSRLEMEHGPEIVLITPKYTDGWLSQYTMDVFRIRLINKLRQADKHNRLRVYFPDGPGLEEYPVNIHAKVMIVDDEVLTVGSANLNNRSMALDNECNIAINSDHDPAKRNAISSLRNRLLAEHLGCGKHEVESESRDKNSLIRTIDSLNNTRSRHLNDLPLELPANVNQYVPDAELVDPEHPIEMEKLIKKIIPEEEHAPARNRIFIWIGIVLLMLVLAGIWQWTPMKEWINIETVSGVIEYINGLPAAPVLIITGFVVAGLLSFPFSLLVLATVITFGPLWGFIYSMLGGTFSAVVVYGIGYITGRNIVRKLAGSRLNRISRKLSQHGVLTVSAVRIIPVAPFTIINLVAGASHIRFLDYLAGTILGMAPGMLAITLLIDRISAVIWDPNLANAGMLGIVFGLVILCAFVLIKWLLKKNRSLD